MSLDNSTFHHNQRLFSLLRRGLYSVLSPVFDRHGGLGVLKANTTTFHEHFEYTSHRKGANGLGLVGALFFFKRSSGLKIRRWNGPWGRRERK